MFSSFRPVVLEGKAVVIVLDHNHSGLITACRNGYAANHIILTVNRCRRLLFYTNDTVVQNKKLQPLHVSHTIWDRHTWTL